jgi:ATP-dependent exoDNAse (exonuclease V) alpha subunit
VSRGHRADQGVDRARLFAELAGPAGVTARRSTFDRRDAIKAVCQRLPAGAPVGAVVGLVDGFLACDQVVGWGDADPSTRWTTLDLLACERHLVDTAAASRRSGVAQVSSGTVAAVLDTRPGLADEQRWMVAGLCRSGNGVDIVIGAAGSGKTSGLAVARHAWETSGHTVIGCALAARAAEQLADGAGIPSTTVDRLLGDLDTGRRHLGSRHVVIVDEAGMVGTRHLDRLLRHTSAAQAKLVLVGDPAQLPAIDAGGALAGLARRLRPHHLTENHRQVEPWEQQALAGMRAGATSSKVARAYADHHRVEDHTDIDTVINHWTTARDRGADVLLLAGRRDQVTALNRAARARLQGEGVVGPDRCVLSGRPYAIGDHIVTLRNDHHLGVLNGTRGVITDTDDNQLRLRLPGGRHVNFPHAYAEAGWVDHGYALTIHKAQGLTAEETITLADDTLAREHTYVALSRGRLTNRLIVALTDGFDEHAEPHCRPPRIASPRSSTAPPPKRWPSSSDPEAASRTPTRSDRLGPPIAG